MWGRAPFSPLTAGATLLQTLHAWMWCLLVFAWGARLLNRKSRALAWLNEAVYRPTSCTSTSPSLDGVRWNHRHELVDVNGPWYTLRGGWRAGVLRLVSADGLPAAFRRTAWGSEEAEKLWPFTAVDEAGPKFSST